MQNIGLKKSGTIVSLAPYEKRNLRKINLLNFKESQNQIPTDHYINLPIPGKRKRYIFGDFVTFVQKVNKLHRLILLKKGLNSTTFKFDEEIKSKYKSLKKNNIYNFNFSNHICNIFADINFTFNYYERNYQGKLNIYKLCLSTKKLLSLLVIKKIYIYIDIKNNKAIKIQSNIKRLIISRKIKVLKKERYDKAVTIQKYVKGFIIRNKYKEQLVYIVDNIKYNKMQKDYERQVKIMIKKRNAIRVIECWWEKILEERKQKELEEKIKKMPIDCQKLYRQFIKLRKQTKSIKNEFNEFAKEKCGFVP